MMQMAQMKAQMEQVMALVEEINFNPYYNVIDGDGYIDLASNNYLGLAMAEATKKAAAEAIMRYGTSMCGSPVANGYIGLFRAVEKKLAEFIGLDDALIFPSCYQANTGVFVALAGDEDVIIVDTRAHSSIMQGIKGVRCKVFPFRHNDMGHLEKILSRSGAYAHRYVVTDSVFSTDGSLAPIGAIVDLCGRYDAIPVVDDSHGFGVLGKTGRGALEHFGIEKFGGIYTASLAKAFANNGGVLAGSFEILEYLRLYCPHLAYSTAVPPAILGGILGALYAIEKDFARLAPKMWDYRHRIRSSVTEAGIRLLDGVSPINAVFTGNVRNTLLLSKALYEKGVLSMAFIEPSVPKGECLVRLVANAGLDEDQIERACEIIGECGCGISWS